MKLKAMRFGNGVYIPLTKKASSAVISEVVSKISVLIID